MECRRESVNVVGFKWLAIGHTQNSNRAEYKKNRVKQNKFKLHIHKNHTINKWKKVVVDTMIFHINIFVSFNWFYKIFASKFSIKNEAIIVQSGRLLLTLYKSYTYSHIIDFNSDLRADLWWLHGYWNLKNLNVKRELRKLLQSKWTMGN